MVTPHKKIVVISIICLSVIFSTVIYTNKESIFSKKEEPEQNKIVLSTIDSDQIKDTDSDGLKDWEENLLGTDYKNPDTDKDGTPDGEEIKNNRDPREKGPNDKITKTTYIKEKSNVLQTEEKSTSLTENLSQAFILNYLASKQENKEINQTESLNIANKTVDNITLNTQPKQYSQKDVIISDSTTKEEYKLLMEKALEKNRPTIDLRNEFFIVRDALKANRKTDLNKLDLIILAYKGTINDFLLVKVPRNAAGMHLELLNILAESYDDIIKMKSIFDDPVVGYTAIQKHQITVFKLKAIDSIYDKYFN